MWVSPFLSIALTGAIFKISGKMPSAKDWLEIKLKGLDKMSALCLKIVTGILVKPKAFLLCNWDISFRISYWVLGLSTNEFSEGFLRKLINFSQELGMVSDKLDIHREFIILHPGAALYLTLKRKYKVNPEKAKVRVEGKGGVSV